MLEKEKLVEALGITVEQAEKIVEAHKKELEGFIPKYRFDDKTKELEAERARAEALDNQIKELQQFKGTAEEYKSKIAELEQKNQEAISAHQSELERIKKMGALKDKLMSKENRPLEKSLNTLMNQYNLDEIKLNEKGEITSGFDSQDKVISADFDFCYPQSKPKVKVKGEEPEDGAAEGDTHTIRVDEFIKSL